MQPFPEVRELADDVRRLFEELERAAGPVRAPASEYTPTLDVCDCRERVEIVVDLAGVSAAQVRVFIKASTVVIAGEKRPACGDAGDATFHLVERGFGRFARAVRLTGAFDASGARAVLRHGELRIDVPKIGDRRGAEIPVAIETAVE